MGILKATEFDIPIISVGNITVGGTGKTPHVEYLIRLLKDDFRLAVLSRGYMRKTKKFTLATTKSTVADIGDEPLQIKKKYPFVEVAVEKKRVKGIKKLLEINPELEAILLDDAYQHRYVKPGLSILLIDYNRPLEDDYMLPLGHLREPAYQKRRANIIIITKCPHNLKPIEKRMKVKELNLFAYQSLYFTTLTYADPLPVFENYDTAISATTMKEEKPTLLMLTGIANPNQFKKHLRTLSGKIKEIAYPDHHNYSQKDINKIMHEFEHIANTHKYIITTEKDAMRLKAFTNLPENFKALIYYVPLEIEFMYEDADCFNAHISDYVKHNKKDNILLKGNIKKHF